MLVAWNCIAEPVQASPGVILLDIGQADIET